MMMRAGESRSHGLARPGLQSIRCASFLKSGRACFGAHDPPALQGPRILFVRQDGRDEDPTSNCAHGQTFCFEPILAFYALVTC